MRKKVLLIAAMTAALSTVGLSAANASPTDVGGAALSNTLDTANATLDNVNAAAADPNTTCKVTATGTNVVQRTNALVAEVYAEDVVVAAGSCVSLSSGTYSVDVTVQDQYYVATSATTGYWTPTCSAGSGGSSVAGVAQPLPATAVCQFAFPSSALNRYHRAVGVLTNSRGQRFVDISPIWFVSA